MLKKAQNAFEKEKQRAINTKVSRNNFFVNLTSNRRNKNHTNKINKMVKILGKDKATRVLASKWNNYKSKKDIKPDQNAHMMNQNWRECCQKY